MRTPAHAGWSEIPHPADAALTLAAAEAAADQYELRRGDVAIDIPELPVVISAPQWLEEQALADGVPERGRWRRGRRDLCRQRPFARDK